MPRKLKRLTDDQAAAVKDLVTAVRAYTPSADRFYEEPNNGNLANDVLVWGRIILDTQAALGVQIVNPIYINGHIARAEGLQARCA